MLSDYISAAMKRAKYKLAEDGTYFGEIPGFAGVWANRDNLEDCRSELQEVLEGWLILGLRKGAELPIIDGISLLSASPVA
mgnify:CR=1 FL=1